MDYDPYARFAPATVAAQHNTGTPRKYWTELFTPNQHIEVLPEGQQRWGYGTVRSISGKEGSEVLVVAHNGGEEQMFLSVDWPRVRVPTPAAAESYPVGMRVAYYANPHARPAVAQVGTVIGNIDRGQIVSVLLDPPRGAPPSTKPVEVTLQYNQLSQVKALTNMIVLCKPDEDDGKSKAGGGGGAGGGSHSAATAVPAGKPTNPLLWRAPKAMPKAHTSHTPDMTTPVDQKKMMEEFERYTPGKEIEVYWVDQREWRAATVLMAWDGRPDDGVCLQVHFTGYSASMDETLNLQDKTVFRRVRLMQYANSGDGERKAVTALWATNNERRPGERWNVLSRAWWLKWLAYSGFNPDRPSVAGRSGGVKPGEITNSALCVSGTTELVQGLSRAHDYEEVPNSVWKQLLDWYGGGPTIERCVITLGGGATALELYPAHMAIWVTDPKTGAAVMLDPWAPISKQFSLSTLLTQYNAPGQSLKTPGRVWMRTDAKAGDSKAAAADTKTAADGTASKPSPAASPVVSAHAAIVASPPSADGKTADVLGLGAIPVPTTAAAEAEQLAAVLKLSQQLATPVAAATPTPTSGAATPAAAAAALSTPASIVRTTTPPLSASKPANGAGAVTPPATADGKQAPATAKAADEWKLISEADYALPFGSYPAELRPREVLLEWRTPALEWPRTRAASQASQATKDWRDFRRDDVLDAMDASGTWYEAQIVGVDEKRGIKVHFLGFDAKHDEWIDRASDRLAPKNKHTSGPHIPNSAFNVQSVEGRPDVTGAVGLKNLGQSCYMAASVQCLSAVEPLARYFLDPQLVMHINRDGGKEGAGGRLAEEFATLLQQMYSDKYRAVAPLAFKAAMGSFRSKFYDAEQQDTHEFLTHLLDGLHEDTNTQRVKPKAVAPKDTDAKGAKRPETELADDAWAQHRAGNASFVHSLFWCQTKTRVACPACSATKVAFDPANVLACPIPSERKRAMDALVVPYDLSAPVRRVTALVNELCDLREYKATFAAACKVPASRLTVRSVSYYRIMGGGGEDGRVPWTDDTLHMAANADREASLQLYETPPESERAGYVTVQLAHCCPDGSQWSKCGIPMLLWLKKSQLQRFPYAELHAMARKVAVSFFPNEFRGKPANAEMPFDLALCDRATTSIERMKLPTDGFVDLTPFINSAIGMGLCCLWRARHLNWEHVLPVDAPGANAAKVAAAAGPEKAQLRTDLVACLNAYFHDDSEKFERVCSACKAAVRFKNRTLLWRLPDVLVIVLRRFSEESRLKNDAFVDFPLHGLDMRPYVDPLSVAAGTALPPLPTSPMAAAAMTSATAAASADAKSAPAATPVASTATAAAPAAAAETPTPAAEAGLSTDDVKGAAALLSPTAPATPNVPVLSAKSPSSSSSSGGDAAAGPAAAATAAAASAGYLYDCVAVANHLGTYIGSGHYVANAMSWHNQKWYHFNDQNVKPIDAKDIVSANAYVLFYKRRG